MRIRDLSSDVCSSDLRAFLLIIMFSCSEFDAVRDRDRRISSNCAQNHCPHLTSVAHPLKRLVMTSELPKTFEPSAIEARWYPHWESKGLFRSEEHTSELQSLMRISYAVFCLKKKKHKTNIHTRCPT